MMIMCHSVQSLSNHTSLGLLQAMEPSFEQLAADHAANANLRIAKFQADDEREFATSELGLKTFPTIVFLPKNSNTYIKYPSELRDVHTLSLWLRNVASA